MKIGTPELIPILIPFHYEATSESSLVIWFELTREAVLGIYNKLFVDPKQTALRDASPQRPRAGAGRFPLCSVAHESIREKSN